MTVATALAGSTLAAHGQTVLDFYAGIWNHYQPQIRRAQQTGRLPKWLDASDQVRFVISTGPGLGRDNQRWLYVCLQDSKTAARWVTAAPASVAGQVLKLQPYPWSPTVAMHRKDIEKCAPWPS